MSEIDQEINKEVNGHNFENGNGAESELDKTLKNQENMDTDDKENVENMEDEVEDAPKFALPEQGPKNYGIKSNPEEEALEAINKELLDDPDYSEVENLPEQLQTFKDKFLEFDKDAEGNIDMLGLSRMLEKVGQPKTHLEMKKMIREIDRTNKGTICYRDFINMMLGPKNSVLKLILMFEQKSKAPEKPTGVAPKRDLSSLP